MKKLLFFLSFITLSFIAGATDRYISPTGNNANAGTLAAPWKTLAYACANTVSGDVIHVLAGTYNETTACNLKVGVSIDGVGVTSNIVSTYTGGAAISLTSGTDGTNGNQSISNIKLDGSNLTGSTGILILARSNVKVFNCTIQDFLQNGIIFNGSNNFGQPAVYMTGCELYNCIITNNSDRNTGQGNIVATGYRGLLIHDNVLTQTSRPLGHNGNTLSATTAGYSEGLKFYNNISYRNPNEGNEWSFHLELWDSQGGQEIYNNEFHGGTQMIDFGGSDSPILGIMPGNYAYAAYVHDNLFQFDTPVTGSTFYQEVAINIEGNADKITISNNHFKNCPYGVQLTLNHTTTGHSNVTINNNLFENGGYVNNEWGFDIDILSQTGTVVSGIQILNNTFSTNSLSALFIYMNAGATVSDVSFINNIVKGVRSYGFITFVTNDGTKANYTVKNNLLYQNANSNSVSLQSGAALPINWIYTGNFIANPLLDASFLLTASSPAINAGINVGLPYCSIAPDDGWKEYCPSSIPPVANAGIDQTITLPVSNVTLSGTATTSGTISSWVWRKVSGGNVVIGPDAQTTTATGLVQGVYQFELKVTDNAGLTDVDTIQVTVNAAPITPPNCTGTGTSTITLPTATAALVMTATSTTGGSISSYGWLKTSGPVTGSIQNATLASTNAINLVQGTYIFTGTATDNNGQTCTAVRTIIVNPAPNVNPTANAGADQNIQLPTTSVNISGSGTDPDGTISTYLWTKISGPVAGTITNSALSSTSITGLTLVGVYKYELRVTDNNGGIGKDTMQITVVAAANIPPTANAGADKTITLPVNTVSLSGTGTDVDGTITAYFWQILSGPGTGSISNTATANTSMLNLVQGVYQVLFTVTDNNGSTASDQVQVTVNAAIPVAPTCNAGTTPITITPPTATVALAGTAATSPISNGYTVLWERTLPGSGGTIANSALLVTSVSGLAPSTTYNYRITITDNVNGLTCQSTKVVVVNPAPNVNPTANAGTDQVIQLPTTSVNLTGSGTDPDGTITGYLWTKVSGPTAGTITSSASATTSVTGLSLIGIYKYELRVTDNSGGTGKDTVQITVVAAANVPPTANAGTDQTITLPLNIASLTGSGTDTDGSIVSYGWAILSSPGSGSITSANTANSSIINLVQGTYQVQLTVTDNSGAQGTDIMQITVNAAPIIAPTANAGADKVITLPTNSAALNGVATGTGKVVLWSKLSGSPSGGAIANSAAEVTSVSGLIEGVYKYELRVTNSAAQVARDTMQITVLPQVLPPVLPPVVNAGSNIVLAAGTTSSTLNGSVSVDINDAVSSYSWQQIGSSSTTIATPTLISTNITGLTSGDFYYSLTVVTVYGYIVSDTVKVTVLVPNIPILTNIIFFSGVSYQKKITLTWQSEVTPNSVAFNMQRKNIWGNFKTIGNYILPVIGVKNYSFVDNNPTYGTNTYRVKVTDKTAVSYSNQISIKKK